MLTYGPDGERRGEGMRVFVWAFAPPPRMIVFGAIDFAAAVARMGGFLGYHVTVCDARPVFATASRFPSADEVVVSWPHTYLAGRGRRRPASTGRTVLCVLTHDPKFDVPLLEVALRLPEVGYVGAMGSRRTHDDRLRAARARPGSPTTSWPGCPRRSASTSGRAPPRRPRSASPRRSSRCSGAAVGSGSWRPRAASTTGRRDALMTIHTEHPFRDAVPDPVRRLRGRLGGAVTLWTAARRHGPAGLTVSSVMVANGEPAHVVALLDPDSDLAEALATSGAGRRPAARRGATATSPRCSPETAPAPGGKFAQAEFVDTAWGPRLADAGTWAGVACEDARELGWSLLVTCRLEHVEVGDDDEPLVHRRGRYVPPRRPDCAM